MESKFEYLLRNMILNQILTMSLHTNAPLSANQSYKKKLGKKKGNQVARRRL